MKITKALLLLLMTTTSQIALSAPPLPIPQTENVVRIVARDSGTFDFATNTYSKQTTTEDRGKIDEVLSLITALNNSFDKPFGTFPTPEYTLLIHTKEDGEIVVWIGANWIGGRGISEDSRANRLRPLDTEMKLKLLQSLRLK